MGRREGERGGARRRPLSGSELGARLGTAVVLFHSAVAERLGMNVTDFRCAELIARSGPLHPGQLAEMTGMSTAATTLVLDRLERAGLVRREPDAEDRRRVRVSRVPNPERDKELRELFSGLTKAMGELATRYDAAQWATISDFIERSSEVLQEEARKLRQQLRKLG